MSSSAPAISTETNCNLLCRQILSRNLPALTAMPAGTPSLMSRSRISVQPAVTASPNGQCFFDIADCRLKSKLPFFEKNLIKQYITVDSAELLCFSKVSGVPRYV